MIDMTPEEYQEVWNNWHSEYEIGDFIEYSEENWEKVQTMDTHYIWTSHNTCEDEMVTSGTRLFQNSCCWDTFGWYVAKKPWEGDPDTYYESHKASAYLPCHLCNPDGEGDEEDFNPECDFCSGEGYVHHFFD